MQSISPLLLEQLTAAQLAEVRRCLHAHWQKAVLWAEQQALDEGGVWDADRQAFRDLLH